MTSTLVVSRLITHSFIVILAVAAAIASSASVGVASRTSLGGRGFVSSWRGQDLSALPADARRSELRAPAIVRTQSTEDDAAATAAQVSNIPVSGEPVSVEAPAATAPVKRREVAEYEIATGDTVSGIAARFGISTETLLWSNNLKPTSLLQPGDKLKVLPVDGTLYEVKAGDTLSGIAARYKVTVEDITGYPENNLADSDKLVLAQSLVIPGATKPVDPPVVQALVKPVPAPEPAPAPAPPARVTSAGLVWPTYGPIFTYFGYGHGGLDISPPYGTPVVAAAGGVIAKVNLWNYSYGWHIIMDNGSGVETLYAHLSKVVVSVGETVAQGQLIGLVGSTGRSTGPHLHFEVHRGGGAVDPLGLLPR